MRTSVHKTGEDLEPPLGTGELHTCACPLDLLRHQGRFMQPTARAAHSRFSAAHSSKNPDRRASPASLAHPRFA